MCIILLIQFVVEVMNRRMLAYTLLLVALHGCASPHDPNKAIPEFLLKFPSESFATPVGPSDYSTEQNDWADGWYNAQDFGENRHLGEDWNKTTGGDTDCGETVYAAADGGIIYAGDAGPGWGGVIIVEHTAPDGTKLRSLYGHLEMLLRTSGTVKRREAIGTIGSANGRYKCHLHFELRWNACPVWNEVGPGYSDARNGWIDPSEFIEKTKVR
ncbi:MAG TPA: M23 family metallopeptidase [Pyrinomonadaceae bacterium]|nr:M23 family metallopeptidase [Pyrinomonadaceae bacterium]